MSRQIDWTQPLSEADEAWAVQFSQHHDLIRMNKAEFATDDAEESLGGSEADVKPYIEWTKDQLVAEVGKRELASPAKAKKEDLAAILEADDDAAEGSGKS